MKKEGEFFGAGRGAAILDRWTGLPAAAVVLLAGLVIVGVQNLHLVNTDGVAYMRIAQYWATGQTRLMISGYWGPLLSWIMVPFMWVGMEPLPAARMAMGVSGAWFWFGSVRLAQAAGFSDGWVRGVAWMTIPVAVGWSVEAIVPDLLLGGCVAVASSQLFSSDWIAGRRRQVLCGVAWGIAYWAKAVAFPLGLLVLTIGTVLWRRTGVRGQATKAFGVSLLALMATVAPWISTLSVKYGRVTFSTSARIAHAVVGPEDRERSHPYGREFHVPEPGRITVWEDPSAMAYSYWSPLESWAYFEHQCRLVIRNLGTVGGLIWGFGFAGVAFTGLFALGFPASRDVWRWCAWVPLLLSGLYLPVYVKVVDHRYLEPAWPFLVVSGLGVAKWLEGRVRGGLDRLWVLWMVFSLGMLVPGWEVADRAWRGIPDPASLYAQDLASRLSRAGVSGPVAGHGLVLGGRVGMLTSFLLGTPWVGESSGGGGAGFLKSGAAIAVVSRGGKVAGEMSMDPRFQDLDPVLFKPGEGVEGYALQVFSVLGPGPAGSAPE